MKNLLKVQLIVLLVLSFNTVSAQITITLDSLDGQLISGSEYVIDTIPTNSITVPHFYVTNNTGGTENISITRKVLTQPDGWFNSLCWGDLCYAVSPSIVWSSETKQVFDTQTEELSIYVGAPVQGIAHYRYYIGYAHVYHDSVDVIVKVETNGIDVQIVNNLKLYPNPASNVINLEGVGEDLFSITIYDSFGHELNFLDNLLTKTIDVSNLPIGLYLFLIEDKQTGKIRKEKVIIER